MTSMFPTDFIYVMFSLVRCTAGKSEPQKLNVTVKQSGHTMKRVSGACVCDIKREQTLRLGWYF